MGPHLWTTAKSTTKKLFRKVPGLKRLVVLWDRMAVLEQSLAVLRSSLQSRIMLQESRYDQRLAELRDALGQPAIAPIEEKATPGLSAAGLEFLMAHSRLPAPPSRILDLAGILNHGGLDWRSLGYDVQQSTARITGDWNAVLCRLDEKPAAREGAVAQALDLLQSGGRLILSMSLPENEAPPSWLTQLPAKELVRARREDANWTFAAPRSIRSGRERSLLLGVVEKP